MFQLRALDFLKISPGWYSETFFCVPIGEIYTWIFFTQPAVVMKYEVYVHVTLLLDKFV